jgi:hypothetical protein
MEFGALILVVVLLLIIGAIGGGFGASAPAPQRSRRPTRKRGGQPMYRRSRGRGGMKYHIHLPGGQAKRYYFRRGGVCPFCRRG